MRLSWLALLAERVWEALLWPFLVVAAFLVVSLLELWSLLPPLMHRLVLGGFGLALIVSFLPLVRLSLPTRQEALRRLERNAGIKHRPASSYEDRLGATPAKETAALWAVHRHAPVAPHRQAQAVVALAPHRPRRPLCHQGRAADRRGRRHARGRRQWLGSPARGLPPRRLERTRAAQARRLGDAPVYTGIAPIVLADGSEKVGAGAESFRALSVPERSELIVRTHAPQGETVSLTTSRDATPRPRRSSRRRAAAKGWSSSPWR